MRNRVPLGQDVTEEFPVLHYGRVPRIDIKAWRFSIFGLVDKEMELDWDVFRSLPTKETNGDIHCVTGWSKLDIKWEGVPAKEILKLVRLKPQARFVLVHASRGWTTNLALDELIRPEVLFAFNFNGNELTPEHGWPLRLVVPQLYFWKSAKWVTGLELIEKDQPGFWEQAGYHMHGDPWKEERYR